MKDSKAALGFIFTTILIDVIGFGIVIPVFPKLISELTGEGLSGASQTGAYLLFSYAFIQFIFSPILGALSDKVGRRPILLLSLLGLGIDYILQAVSPTIFLLFIGRLFAGICGSSYTTASAYIADVSTPEKKAQNFGLIGVAFGVGFIIGPIIGGVAGDLWGPRMPFFIAAGITLLNFIYGFVFVPESLSKENRRSFQWRKANPVSSLLNARKYPLIGGLFAAIFLINLAGHAVQSNWTFYTMYRFEWDELMVGLSLGFVGVLVAVVQGGLIRVLIPKFGDKKSVYIGIALNALGLFLFGIATDGWMMFAILIPYALGGIAGPAIQGIMSNQIPSDHQGELQGTLTSIMSMTTILGPLIMNNLFAFFTGKSAFIHFPGISFELAALLALGGLFLAYRTLNKKLS